jgi:hypothetical protein
MDHSGLGPFTSAMLTLVPGDDITEYLMRIPEASLREFLIRRHKAPVAAIPKAAQARFY